MGPPSLVTASVVTSSDAYTKALLHGYKYPTQPVLGMLVGKQLQGSEHQCYVADVLPLFHSLPMTAPHAMLEVAYAHTQSAARTKGLSFLGVYLANERLHDRSVSDLSLRLLESLQPRVPSEGPLLVWMVDNETLTSPPTSLSVTAFFLHPTAPLRPVPRPSEASTRILFGRWNLDTVMPEATTPVEAVLEELSNALDAFAHFRLVDFEDHLEDPQVDYINQPLASILKK